MLTDTALRNLKPKSKIYKASDRDGMYVTVSPTGTGAIVESGVCGVGMRQEKAVAIEGECCFSR